VPTLRAVAYLMIWSYCCSIRSQRIGRVAIAVIQARKRRRKPLLEPSNEGHGVERLAQRDVVKGPVLLEVSGQAPFRIAPPPRAYGPHLSPADGVPERREHAHLVGHSLDASPLVDDGLAPLGRTAPYLGTPSSGSKKRAPSRCV
jgi:hypothetical protein